MHLSYKNITLPEEGFVKLNTILAIIPIAKSTWYGGIKDGRFPKPIKLLGAKSSAWRVDDIRALINKISEGSYDK